MSKNIVNDDSTLVRSASGAPFSAMVISDGYWNDMPTASSNAAPNTPAIVGTRASTTRPAVSPASAIVTARTSPTRSGNLAPTMRSTRQPTLYVANTHCDPLSPTDLACSGMNALNEVNPAMPQASTTPGRSAAGWMNAGEPTWSLSGTPSVASAICARRHGEHGETRRVPRTPRRRAVRHGTAHSAR